jgi:uncharacterized delta-60 repeat protein
VRYNADGSLDTTFAIGGIAETAIGEGKSGANAVVVQPDGKIIVAGGAMVSATDTNSVDFGLLQYLPDGNLDPSFGTGGKVTTDFGATDSAAGIALQGDGKLVVAGNSGDSSNSEIAVARYNSDGSLDATFGMGGKVTSAPVAMDAIAQGIAIQADGRIIVGGAGEVAGQNREVALMRYQGTGNICGNGAVEAGEQCDDGNTTDGDCCSATCQYEQAGALCASGTCNGGGSCVTLATTSTTSVTTSTSTTTSTNATAVCGNGIRELGEQCDDGPSNGADGCCSASCGMVDLDGDGVCNRDDPDDAAITVTKAKVRRSTFAPKPNGGITVNGAFLTSPPADTFSTASGISIRVQDGATLNSLFTWAVSECTTKPSGLIKCQSVDRVNKGTFKPITKAPGQWAFACSFRRLRIAAPSLRQCRLT